jgi:UDP-2,4-diacetamido-2,4,6-trideoxy-beta-L-altropyranose hydrolase
MKIVFRVDASIQIGIGHVMRCLVLAEALQENGVNVSFICRNHDGSLIDKIRAHGFNVFELELFENIKTDNKLAHSSWLGATQRQDSKECINIVQLGEADWLIVDHYAIDEEWHNELSKHCRGLMVIDDIADRKFQCNILLNQNLGFCKDDYKNKVPNNCKLLLGCDYALLRPEFSDLREKASIKRKNTKEIKNILISMGGSDITNKTYDILKSTSDDLNIVVILGRISPYNGMIKNYANSRKNIKVIVDADNVSELMFDADLAIGAGGSTSWERCCLGLPALLFITAENQIKIAENLVKLDAVRVVGNLKESLQDILNDFSLWQTMSKKAQIVCDGLGVKRVKIWLK